MINLTCHLCFAKYRVADDCDSFVPCPRCGAIEKVYSFERPENRWLVDLLNEAADPESAKKRGLLLSGYGIDLSDMDIDWLRKRLEDMIGNK